MMSSPARSCVVVQELRYGNSRLLYRILVRPGWGGEGWQGCMSRIWVSWMAVVSIVARSGQSMASISQERVVSRPVSGEGALRRHNVVFAVSTAVTVKVVGVRMSSEKMRVMRSWYAD